MAGPVSHPAPAPGVNRPSGYPPDSDAARRAAVPVGAAYAKFEVLSEDFCDHFLQPQSMAAGVVLWDRMSQDQKRALIAKVQQAYQALPPLPTATNPVMAAAVREGFSMGANTTYENERFKTRALWVVAELAKAAIFALAAGPAGAGAVTVRGIGSAFTTRFSDCAAQTASRLVLEMNGAAIDAGYFFRRFGLPRQTISTYEAAQAYARNWFEQVGIKLAPKSGGFGPVAAGGTEGHYVVFFKGGASGGHVVYGRVSPNGILVIDNQLGGRTWDSLMSAERVLGMQAQAAYRVEHVTLP
jgi:hypothetical protein